MVVDSQVPPNLMLPVLVRNVWAYGGARDFTCWQTQLLSLKPEVNTRLGTVLGHPLLPVALRSLAAFGALGLAIFAAALVFIWP